MKDAEKSNIFYDAKAKDNMCKSL